MTQDLPYGTFSQYYGAGGAGGEGVQPRNSQRRSKRLLLILAFFSLLATIFYVSTGFTEGGEEVPDEPENANAPTQNWLTGSYDVNAPWYNSYQPNNGDEAAGGGLGADVNVFDTGSSTSKFVWGQRKERTVADGWGRQPTTAAASGSDASSGSAAVASGGSASVASSGGSSAGSVASAGSAVAPAAAASASASTASAPAPAAAMSGSAALGLKEPSASSILAQLKKTTDAVVGAVTEQHEALNEAIDRENKLQSIHA